MLLLFYFLALGFLFLPRIHKNPHEREEETLFVGKKERLTASKSKEVRTQTCQGIEKRKKSEAKRAADEEEAAGLLHVADVVETMTGEVV